MKPMQIDDEELAHRNSVVLLNRVSAQAMGLEANALCHRSHWVPKSTRTQCSNCKSVFKLFSAKHHCRLCGEVVCGACSNKRILFQKKSVRACDECVKSTMQVILDNRDGLHQGKASSCVSTTSSSSMEHEIAAALKDASMSASSNDPIADVKEIDGSTRKVALLKPLRKPPSVADEVDNVLMYKASRYHSQAWRSQLPYALVLFLLTIAGVTNVWSLF